MTRLVLSNARIVLADEIIDGSLAIENGAITAIDSGPSTRFDDLEGDYLIPGLVELHTDHLESHFHPRPGVEWPAASAVISHDAQIAAAGITTVFDALSAQAPLIRAISRPAMANVWPPPSTPRRPADSCAPNISFTCVANCPARIRLPPRRAPLRRATYA